MARTRLNLKNLSITDKLAKGRQIVTAMTNNASFPNPGRRDLNSRPSPTEENGAGPESFCV